MQPAWLAARGCVSTPSASALLGRSAPVIWGAEGMMMAEKLRGTLYGTPQECTPVSH